MKMALRTDTISRPSGGSLAVTRTTAEPECLFVHGATETAEAWAPLLKYFDETGRGGVAVDLRGHGKSSGHEVLQNAGINDYVEDVLTVLASYPRVRTLVGHSMGGLIAQLTAARADIDVLVLVASSPVDGMRADGMRMARKHPWTFIAASLRRSFRRLYDNERVARSLLFHRNTPDSVVRSFISSLQEESWRAGNEMNTLLPDPAIVKCRVIVLAGAEDFMVSRQSSERTARAYNVRLEVLENCAHAIPAEAEPSVLAALIENSWP